MSNSSRGPGRPSGGNRNRKNAAFSGRAQRTPSTYQSPARRKLEALSYKPLKAIHTMPRLVLPIVMGALLLAGLLIPFPLAGLLLVLLGLLLTWLVALSWPALEMSARAIRVIVILIIFAAAVWKLSGNV
ncbi:MAG: DUF6703 family protein [Candidatus Nanopelagicales bacterium]